MPSKSGQPKQRRPMKWNDEQQQVFIFVFEGRKSQAKIAEECGIPLRTCEDWIAHPEFQAKLAEKRNQIIDSLAELGVPYVRKEQRIMGLAHMAEDARAQYEAHPLLREIRPLPPKSVVRIKTKSANGEEQEEETEPLDAIVNESFNDKAHSAFRESLADIAAELGARKNVTELGGSLDLTNKVLFVLPEKDDSDV